MIVRDALLGTTRFDGFLRRLGIARNVLTGRLNALVQHEVLERRPYRHRPLRYEYHLTPKGRELTPVIISLMEWGDRYFDGDGGPPRVAEHLDCGGHVEARLVCEVCGRAVAAAEVSSRPGRRGGAPMPMPLPAGSLVPAHAAESKTGP